MSLLTFADVEEEGGIDLASWALAITDNAKTSRDWIDFLRAVKEKFSQLDQDLKRECKSAATALIKLHLLGDVLLLQEFSQIIDMHEVYKHHLPGTKMLVEIGQNVIDFCI